MSETLDRPSDDPPNVAVLTTKRIMRDGNPILLVVHEAEDEGWQFLDGFTLTEADASVVGLRTIASRDKTIMELADLLIGWQAERADANSAWMRTKTPPMNE